MFRNYLAAALRNVVRNRLYAGINIVGVTLGFVAVLLIALFVRDELTFDRFIPGSENVYRLAKTLHNPNGYGKVSDGSSPNEAALIKADIPQVQAAVRLWPEERGVRRGAVEASEIVIWADPSFFDVFPLGVRIGAKDALSRPDTAVITRRIAQKYFGRDDVVGETIELDRKTTLQIGAVIETLPSRSHMNVDILAPAASVASPFRGFTSTFPFGYGPVFTYLRFPARDLAIVEGELKDFMDNHLRPPPPPGGEELPKGSEIMSYDLQPLPAIHMLPHRQNAGYATRMFKLSGDRSTVTAATVIGILILLVAIANFVNLMSARASRRAVEVGVRKTSGAQRPHLLAQFMGESLAYVTASVIVAMIAVALALPAFNGFLDRSIPFDVFRDPLLGGGILLLTVLTGAAGGLYPSFVLAAFRPAVVLKGNAVGPQGAGRLRKVLVVGQFAILIVLMAATAIVGRQTAFAMTQRLHVDGDPLLFITAGCRDALKDQIRALAGVNGAACGSTTLLGDVSFIGDSPAGMPDGSLGTMEALSMEPGLPELLGLKLIAGRLATAADATGPDGRYRIVVNETTVRRLRFPSAAAAIGQPPSAPGNSILNGAGFRKIEIIGVVADFPVHSVRDATPMISIVANKTYDYLVVKLDGERVGATLPAIDRLWEKLGTDRPIQRAFYDQYLQAQYLSLVRESQAFIAFAVTAIVIAALGLFGLCVFTAERRTKEIGIRKAMGASRADIVRLLLWEFIRPVVWATLIAWPLGYVAMSRWLEGFAVRVDIDPTIFAAASILAAAIAGLTIIAQIYRVARAEPVTALRYE